MTERLVWIDCEMTGLSLEADALIEVATEQGAPPAAVALAWLTAQPTVACAIASARTPGQVADLLPMAELSLTAAQLERLATAG